MGFVVFHTGFEQAYVSPVLNRPGADPIDASQAVADGEGNSSQSGAGVAAAYVSGGGKRDRIHRKLAKTLGQIMSTPVVTASVSMSVSEAHTIFRSRKFRHLPVVDASRSLVGLISDRDLLGVEAREPRCQVARVMSPKVLTALEHTPLRSAATVMIAEKISALPVIDSEHRLIGMVTTSDLLRCIVNGEPIDLWV